jgi:hypothetical protein
MSDRAESTAPVPPSPPTPPARPEVSPMLRESFIAFFQQHGQESALRMLAELAYQLALEGRRNYLMANDEHALERTKVLSAAGDLRQAAEQLRESARSLAENSSSEHREVLRVTLAIADASAAVQPIADQLDAAVARFLDGVTK